MAITSRLLQFPSLPASTIIPLKLAAIIPITDISILYTMPFVMLTIRIVKRVKKCRRGNEGDQNDEQLR